MGDEAVVVEEEQAPAAVQEAVPAAAQEATATATEEAVPAVQETVRAVERAAPAPVVEAPAACIHCLASHQEAKAACFAVEMLQDQLLTKNKTIDGLTLHKALLYAQIIKFSSSSEAVPAAVEQAVVQNAAASAVAQDVAIAVAQDVAVAISSAERSSSSSTAGT